MMRAGAQTTFPPSHRGGENGHAELTAEGLGDPLLALFDKTVRGLDEARISSFVADIIAEARTKGDAEPLKNLFVLAFQTRWCRGGKGERNVLYHLIVVLSERYAACWWSLWSSFQRTDRGETCSTFSSSAIMATWTIPLASPGVWSMFARQLKADTEELAAATCQGRSQSARSQQNMHSFRAGSTVESSKRTRMPEVFLLHLV